MTAPLLLTVACTFCNFTNHTPSRPHIFVQAGRGIICRSCLFWAAVAVSGKDYP